MKTNTKLDKWAAEKCVGSVDRLKPLKNEGEIIDYVLEIPSSGIAFTLATFTLSDARCREIVMEFFEISTNRGHWHEGKEWEHWFATTDDNKFEADGESIEAAEIACIQAIKDAE